MKDFSSTYTVFLLLSGIMVFSGCFTILGTSMAQSHNKAELWEINRGNLVKIHAIDGRVLKGQFQGTETVGYFDLLLLKRKDNILKIRTTDIEKIQVITQNKNGWIIAVTGFAIDVFIVARVVIGLGGLNHAF